MRSNYYAQLSPHFSVLSAHQMAEIHSASLEILWRTGSRIYCQEALELLKRAGADVSDGTLVRIPPHLVEWGFRTTCFSSSRNCPVLNLLRALRVPAVLLETILGWFAITGR